MAPMAPRGQQGGGYQPNFGPGMMSGNGNMSGSLSGNFDVSLPYCVAPLSSNHEADKIICIYLHDVSAKQHMSACVLIEPCRLSSSHILTVSLRTVKRVTSR